MFLRINFCSNDCLLEGPETLCREIEDFLSLFETERLANVSGEPDFSLVMKDGQAGLLKEGELRYARPFPGGFMVRFVRTITRWFVQRVETDEKILLHAAALEYEDRLMVFCGPSNSGKTTSVEFLLPSSKTFLSDEFTLVDFKERNVQPFPRPINSGRSEEKDNCFRWRQYVNRLGQNYYYGYPPREFHPEGPVWGKLHFIFLRRNSFDGGLRPLSTGEGITNIVGERFDRPSSPPLKLLPDIKKADPSFYELSWREMPELERGLRELIHQ